MNKFLALWCRSTLSSPLAVAVAVGFAVFAAVAAAAVVCGVKVRRRRGVRRRSRVSTSRGGGSRKLEAHDADGEMHDISKNRTYLPGKENPINRTYYFEKTQNDTCCTEYFVKIMTLKAYLT